MSPSLLKIYFPPEFFNVAKTEIIGSYKPFNATRRYIPPWDLAHHLASLQAVFQSRL
ncbi:hypothetical protein L0F63_002340, partial [Massospora cicadina]